MWRQWRMGNWSSVNEYQGILDTLNCFLRNKLGENASSGNWTGNLRGTRPQHILIGSRGRDLFLAYFYSPGGLTGLLSNGAHANLTVIIMRVGAYCWAFFYWVQGWHSCINEVIPGAKMTGLFNIYTKTGSHTGANIFYELNSFILPLFLVTQKPDRSISFIILLFWVYLSQTRKDGNYNSGQVFVLSN